MEGRRGEEEWGDAGQIGVKAEEGGRVSPEGGGAGEVEPAGLAVGRMGGTSVADDWPADWGAGRAKAGGRVAEEGEEAGDERG